ncbi:hypothetical protein PWP93_26710 [Paraburkholderia sp. A1RI-2L]|uniref:hypothetical protein n=1 Tax=Paraburkholderia sp. A1RI-2L TaxID=3028367 RepID=UPI003B76ED0D
MAGDLVSVRAPFEAPDRVISLYWHQRNETVPAHRWLHEQLVDMFASPQLAVPGPKNMQQQ